jgi:DNA-binding MarR family transcriptional regulator
MKNITNEKKINQEFGFCKIEFIEQMNLSQKTKDEILQRLEKKDVIAVEHNKYYFAKKVY